MTVSLARTATDDSDLVPESIEPYPRLRRYLDDPQEKWQLEVQKALVELVEMPEGWDSYRAPAVKRDAGLFALEILHKVMSPRSPAPHVVPSSVGGVQLEWHEKDIDLEIHVSAPYHCEVWFHDHRAGAPQSVDLSNDFSFLEAPIHALTNR